MNNLKLFVTVFAMAIAMNAGAQSKTTAKSKSVTTTAAPAKKTTTAAPVKKTTTTTRATTTTAPAKKKSSSVSNSGYDPKLHFMIETKLGSGFGGNFVLEKEFHKYVAVDFFSIGYTSDDWHVNNHRISVKVGARGYSPSWWGGRMRAYTDLALGYECNIFPGGSYVYGYDDVYDYDPSDYADILSDYGYGEYASYLGDYSSYVGSSSSGVYETSTQTYHGFGLSWGVGIHMFKHFYIGYSLDFTTAAYASYTTHFAKFGFRF